MKRTLLIYLEGDKKLVQPSQLPVTNSDLQVEFHIKNILLFRDTDDFSNIRVIYCYYAVRLYNVQVAECYGDDSEDTEECHFWTLLVG